MSASCDWCVFSGRGLYDGPIPCPGVLSSVYVSMSVIKGNNLYTYNEYVDGSRRRRKEILNAM